MFLQNLLIQDLSTPNLLVNENLFLIFLAIIWIIGAIIQDLKRREVDNIWNFTLIVFALSYRLSLTIFMNDYRFFLNGIIGFIIFLVLGNLFYYSRLFAGGDAKLLIALGTILPLSYSWIINLKIFSIFILSFIFGGSIYVFIWSMFLVFINYEKFKNEFINQFKKSPTIILISTLFILIGIIASFINPLFLLVSTFFLFPLLFIYSKSIEESCLVKKIDVKYLTEGDWLYENIYVKGKKIEKNWGGVSKEELELIRKKYRRKILVKYGIPFTPAFLIGFLWLLLLSKISFL